MKELRARKEKLERDIAELESSFDHKANKAQSTVLSAMRPLSHIRKNPFRAVGTAVLIGFILGAATGKKKKSRPKKNRSDHSSTSSNSAFSSYMMNELKKIAAQKALRFTTEYVERKMAAAQKRSEVIDK